MGETEGRTEGMSERLFVISDVHGFASEAKRALNMAGFDPKNLNHRLIVLGDVFDRGPQAVAVYRWLSSLKRVTLIRGNHETLMRDMVARGIPVDYDISNGTWDTALQLAGETQESVAERYQKEKKETPLSSKAHPSQTDLSGDIDALKKDIEENDRLARGIYADVFRKASKSKAYAWQQGSQWIDYLRLGDFVFVHCWVPVESLDGLPPYYLENRRFAKKPDWEKATAKEWEDAAWGCPFLMNEAGLRPDGLTIVMGHWHSKDFHRRYDHVVNDYSGYAGQGMIALDGCTVLSKRVNVALFDKDGDKVSFVGFAPWEPKKRKKKGQ
jgi:hypothetical protein